jgi:hypothetical protein
MGRNMWGSITSALARAEAPFDMTKYEHVGSTVMNKDVIAGYFFPVLDVAEPLVPQYRNDGLHYGSMDAADFEKDFIQSFGQTAIEPSVNTAEEGSLYETEYIAGTVNFRQVFYVGHVFVKTDSEIAKNWDAANSFKNTVKELFVGGERRYGFGRLALHDCIETSSVFCCDFDGKYDNPCITVSANKPLPAHLIAGSIHKVKGEIEPLVGMVLDAQKGAGQNIGNFGVCWMPGSIVEQETTVTIGEYGILLKKEA